MGLSGKSQMIRNILAGVLGTLLFIVAHPVSAEGIVDEMVVGVLQHDIDLVASEHEGGLAINAELRFISPEFLGWLGQPRPTLGLTYATDSPGTDTAYGGLTWTFDFWKGFYTDLFFGMSLHNGNKSFDHFSALSSGAIINDSSFEKYLGCSVLFREAVELGYRFGNTQKRSVSAMVSHLSHGELLCNDTRNAGMDHWGVRYGYQF